MPSRRSIHQFNLHTCYILYISQHLWLNCTCHILYLRKKYSYYHNDNTIKKQSIYSNMFKKLLIQFSHDQINNPLPTSDVSLHLGLYRVGECVGFRLLLQHSSHMRAGVYQKGASRITQVWNWTWSFGVTSECLNHLATQCPTTKKY